ncbi:NADPH-dependent FMN reductase [Corynebacterium lehmanniae]
MTTIGVFLGSVRTGRIGSQVGAWVMEAGAERDADYRLLDLAEFDVPHLIAEVVPGAANKQYDDPAVTAWSKAVDACDGFVFVTPEYNHSIPGTMKNAFDSLFGEWAGKPVAFVGYGADGGVRAVEHWRQIVANLSMTDIRNQVVLNIFGEDVENGELAPREHKQAALTRALDDLEEKLG